MHISFKELQALSVSSGLAVMGVTSGEMLHEELERLTQWQRDGYAASMQYMLRDPTQLCTPATLLEECNSIISFSVRYESVPHPPLEPGSGRVARYAWGRDYHAVLRERMDAFTRLLREHVAGECTVRGFSDAVPLLERACAARSGLGFIGKNTLLIAPGEGSFSFLAELLTDLIVDDTPVASGKGKCGSCRRCQDRCPTGALDESYRLDARLCISYLTIEKRGAMSLAERAYVGEWIFGCDVCQEVCPFNHSAIKIGGSKALPEFRRELGVGPLLALGEVLSIRSNAEFNHRFSHTPLTRARRVGLLRNAAVVAANTRAITAVPALLEAFSTDSSAVVRQHCIGALKVILPLLDGLEGTHVRTVLESAADDPVPEIAAEVRCEAYYF